MQVLGRRRDLDDRATRATTLNASDDGSGPGTHTWDGLNVQLFEYLGVLISIVMGLGITHLLIGVSKVVHLRESVRHYWVHYVWTLNVMVYIVGIWWNMFWWSDLQEWFFYQFLFILLYAVVLFMAASLLYPWTIRPDLDLREHFLWNRKWFFGTLALAWTIDIPETVMKAEGGMRGLPSGYIVFVSSLIGLSIFAAITKNQRFHAFFTVFWFVWVLGFVLGSDLLARIAG